MGPMGFGEWAGPQSTGLSTCGFLYPRGFQEQTWATCIWGTFCYDITECEASEERGIDCWGGKVCCWQLEAEEAAGNGPEEGEREDNK